MVCGDKDKDTYPINLWKRNVLYLYRYYQLLLAHMVQNTQTLFAEAIDSRLCKDIHMRCLYRQ